MGTTGEDVPAVRLVGADGWTAAGLDGADCWTAAGWLAGRGKDGRRWRDGYLVAGRMAGGGEP